MFLENYSLKFYKTKIWSEERVKIYWIVFTSSIKKGKIEKGGER